MSLLMCPAGRTGRLTCSCARTTCAGPAAARCLYLVPLTEVFTRQEGWHVRAPALQCYLLQELQAALEPSPIDSVYAQGYGDVFHTWFETPHKYSSLSVFREVCSTLRHCTGLHLPLPGS
jgi:hypothetical protein